MNIQNVISKRNKKNPLRLLKGFFLIFPYTNSFTSAANVFGSNLIPGPIVVDK